MAKSRLRITHRLPRFLLGELISKGVEVARSSQREMQGLRGVVVDETRNTFIVDTLKGRKTVPKSGSVFKFEGESELVRGEWLLCKPEDRTKRLAPFVR